MVNIQPPKWAYRFLKWYCHPDLLEEIQGDALELFYRRVDESGESKARRQYIWDVIRFFRWSNLKKSNKLKINSFIMFNSYLKIGFRNLAKNWGISFINIFGLALALGSAITVFIFVDAQYNMDSFHEKKDRIYMLINRASNEDQSELWAKNPFLLGPDLKENSPIVNNMVRADFGYANMRHDHKVFHEKITYVDPTFFSVFDFELLQGERGVLNDRQNMVISQPMAEKYFGDEDPIGKLVTVNYPDEVTQSYLIAGVLEDYPGNSSFRFDIMVPMSNIRELKPKDIGWDHKARVTFIEFQQDRSPGELGNFMHKYVELHNEATSDWKIDSFEFVPLDQMSLRNYEIWQSISTGGHPAGRIAIGTISLILLVLACFNYMNIAVASATKRLKEIALRKVMGGHKKQIVHQFMVENLILCSIAMLIGVLLSYFLFLPGFNSMLPYPLLFSFSSFQLGFVFFAGLLVIVGLASGSYPALYISRFQPVSIFKGSQKLSRKNLFSRILLAIQLILAFTTVVACLVFSESGMYYNEKDWGYDPKGLFTVVVNNETQYHEMVKLAESIPAVSAYTASSHHINSYDPLTTVSHLERQIKSHYYAVAPDYPEVMNLRLIDGQYFDHRQNSDVSRQAMINSEFATKMGWDNPVGQTFTQDSLKYQVIGVVEGFYTHHFHEAISPTFFYITEPENYLYFTFKLPHDQMFSIDDQVHKAWYEIGPNDPYNRTFQMFAFDDFYAQNNGNIALMGVVSFFAIALGCMGLFGLLSFNLQRRMKEFGIRKVLGAGRLSIIKQANKEYLGMIILSFFIGAPVGFVLIRNLLQIIYPEPQAITVIPFAWSLTIMLITVGLTVIGQIARATKINPSEILRSE